MSIGSVSDEVTALGAWCVVCAAEPAKASPGSVSFDIPKFAVLASGRRITLHAERGFGISGPQLPTVSDPLAGLTAQQIERDVRTTVLPDEDGTVDEHPYVWLSELLLMRGGVATAQSLRAVPNRVESSDHILFLSAADAAGRDEPRLVPCLFRHARLLLSQSAHRSEIGRCA